MKKLAGFVILFSIIFVPAIVCSAKSDIKLYREGNTYTVGEAVTSSGALTFNVTEQENTFTLSDESAGIKAVVGEETLDGNAFKALRNYYNDKNSTEDLLFDKYVKLRRSYIPAVQELYRTSFLYGEQDDPASESGMKLFYEGACSIFGEDSAVYVYNLFSSDRLTFNEETHIDLSIPVDETYTLISIGITLTGRDLDESSISRITELLAEIRPDGLRPQTERLPVFSDKLVLEAVKGGVYPALSSGGGFLFYEDKQAGFSFTYPSGFVPYMQNNLGGRLRYSSFKINPNLIFSVSSDPLRPGADPEAAAVGAVRTAGGADCITEEGRREIDGRAFSYVKSETATTAGAIYCTDYFTSDNSMLYRLQLSSRFENPPASALEAFDGILESFKTQGPENAAPEAAPQLKRCINKEEGYSFGYPADWQLKDVSENISHDSFRLVLPKLSGPLDVTIAEGELFRELDTNDDLSSIIKGQRGEDDGLFKSYKQPFDGNTVKLLDLSLRREDSAVYAYRLLDYLDSNGKNRLAYCIDIIRGNKIYSMFITIGEYETEDGRIKDKSVNSAINAVASSFRLEDTPEVTARTAAGETRNRKIVFIEDWLKTNIDPEIKVASAENTAADGSIYIKAVLGSGGYYRVKPDFEKGTLELLSSTLTSTIFKTELDKLKAAYEKRIITGVKTDEAAMITSIDSSASKGSPAVTRTYRVNLDFSGDGVNWETVRADHAGELKQECRSFLSLLLSAQADVQFSGDNAFRDIDAYERNHVVFRTLVHVRQSSIDGFFVLEIDPSNDNIQAIFFKPMEAVLKELDDRYGHSRKGYAITDLSFDDKSFVLRLSLESEENGASKAEDIKVLYNKEKMVIDYDKQ